MPSSPLVYPSEPAIHVRRLHPTLQAGQPTNSKEGGHKSEAPPALAWHRGQGRRGGQSAGADFLL